MSFLTPLFLAGVAALGIPVLLHLIDRIDREGRRFPSLMFVRRLPYRARKRRVLRDRALLALRCLVLVLLALAFARPFITTQASARGAPAVDRVMLLDRSYSMAAGERWARATAIVGERLAALGDNERAALVLFDSSAQTVAGLDDAPALAAAMLADATPGYGGTDFVSALATAAGLLSSSEAARRTVLLVSDLQRIGIAEGAVPGLPAGVDLEVIAVGGETPVNASVALLDARVGGDVGEGLLRVLVTSTGGQPPRGLRLAVEVDGRVVADRPIADVAGDRVTVDVPLPAGGSRPLRVEARIAGDDLAADDALYLVLAPDVALRVLLVGPDEAPVGRGVFIERALAVSRQPGMQVRRIAAGALDAAALSDAEVVVLDDTPLPEEAWHALSARVQQGAGLLLVAGERLGGAWPADSGWLPWRPGEVRETGNPAGLGLRWRNRAHPLPASLGTSAGGDDASLDAAVRRYRLFTADEDGAVVALFDDGAPALLEGVHGAGRLLLYTSTMDARWSALAATPAFAPLVVQAVRHVAGRGPEHAAWRVGEVVDLQRHAASLGASALAAHLRSGAAALVRLPGGDTQAVLDGLLVATQPGFHEVHALGADVAPVPLAVIVDTRESDAALLQAETLRAQVQIEPATTGHTPGASERRLGESGADRLWWWLLLAAMLVLVAESLLARRLAGARGPGRAWGGDA